MSNNKFLGKLLRIVSMILMGLTAVFTLLSGAGTTCVALAAENFGAKMALIAPYKWLYVLFVFVTLAIGVMGIRALIMLWRAQRDVQRDAQRDAYRYSLLTLLAGVIVGLVHMAVSRALRGSSMPVDGVVYTTLLTLAVFLIIRLPGLWEKYEQAASQGDKGAGGTLLLIVAGIMVLSVQYWAGPTHTWNGVNYADAWHTQLTILGWGLCLLGIANLALSFLGGRWSLLTSIAARLRARLAAI